MKIATYLTFSILVLANLVQSPPPSKVFYFQHLFITHLK